MEKTVNHKIRPDRISSRESRVDAIITKESLFTEAYTFATNKIRFAIFDILIASDSSSSS